MKARNKDSITLSFSIKVPGFQKARVASDTSLSYGYAQYYPPPITSSAFGHIEGGLVYVFWRSGEKIPLNPVSIRDCLIYGLNQYDAGCAKLALNKAGVEDVNINNRPGFRLRAMWWQRQCDGGIHEVGSATCYFVPAEEDEKHDFIILCLTRTYHRFPPFAPLEVYTQEESDSIIANWEYERTYPNNIAQLEQAVEQTFRVK